MTTKPLHPLPATNRASRPSLPSCLAAILGLLLTSPAYAQRVIVNGPLMAGDEMAGDLKLGVHLTARRWTSDTRFQFELPVGGDDGKAALLYGTIDLSHPDTYVTGQVGSNVALSAVEKSPDDFAVTMLAGAWAQLVSRSKRGTVIKVPGSGDATDLERLVPSSAFVARWPDDSGCHCPDFSEDAWQPRTPRLACEPFDFHLRPDESSPSFEVAAASHITAKAGKDGWQLVTLVDGGGFRRRGYVRAAPDCVRETDLPFGIPTCGCAADERPPGQVRAQPPEPAFARCRRAILPRGAKLHASDRKTLLLVVRRDFEARLCSTKQPSEWEVELQAASGEVTVRGYFDGAPLPLPDPASAQ